MSPQRFSAHCVPTCAWSSRPLSASLLRKNKRWRARWILSSAIRPTVSVAQQPVKTPPGLSRATGLCLLPPSRAGSALKAGGIGVFLIPYGLLTGTSPEFVNHRRRLLRRHHLMAAFRLPFGAVSGANLVTDLLLFRSRGGELPRWIRRIYRSSKVAILSCFLRICWVRKCAGKRGEPMSSKKPRRGYEVVGTFKKLPDFAERPMCQSCSVTPLQAPKPKAKELLAGICFRR